VNEGGLGMYQGSVSESASQGEGLPCKIRPIRHSLLKLSSCSEYSNPRKRGPLLTRSGTINQAAKRVALQ
jgi:hypothetical protein